VVARALVARRTLGGGSLHGFDHRRDEWLVGTPIGRGVTVTSRRATALDVWPADNA
jgi:hypothetical protein